MIIPTLEEIHTFLIADFYNTYRNDPRGLPDVSEFSFNWKWLRTFAAAVAGGYSNLNSLISDLFPNSAAGDLLRQWAAAKGLTVKTATGARKSKALRVSGNPGQAVDVNQVLVHSSGLRFQTTNADVVGASGTVDVDVAAIDVGSVTRLNAGETLTFAVGVGGENEVATLVLDLDEDGTDDEKDGDLQARLAKRFSDPPRGGTVADWVAWSLEVTGIATAYVYPLRRGWGTVHVAALHAGSGSDRILTTPEIADLSNALNLRRPVGMRGYLVLTVTPTETSVEQLLVPDGELEHEFDWDDTTPPTVTAWDATARKVTFGTRPDSMAPGDRVTFKLGATGAERVIDSLSSTDAIILTLDENGDTPTVTTDVAYSGGPLVQPARQSILDLFASLGTANTDAKRYGTWEGNLRPTAISRAASSVAGVLDGTTLAPVTVTEASDPAFPNDNPIGMLVPGQVLVRRAH